MAIHKKRQADKLKAAPRKRSKGKRDNDSITIDPGAYNGYYRLAFETEFTSGKRTIKVTPGTQVFDIQTSSFTFNVAVDGSGKMVIDSISMPDAAEVDPLDHSTLNIMTLPVTVHPNHYGGPLDGAFIDGFYFLSIYKANADYGYGWQGKQTFHLIPGLLYWIDNGSFVGNSLFGFLLGKKRTSAVVSKINPPCAATPTKNGLRFEVTRVEIKPGDYKGLYLVSTERYRQQLSGNQSFNVIRGLTAGIDTGALVANATAASYFYFAVANDGREVSVDNTEAARADKRVISFRPMTVTITPPVGAPKYRIDTQPSQSLLGEQSVQLMPNLMYWINVNDSFGYFVSQRGGVSSPLDVGPFKFTITPRSD